MKTGVVLYFKSLNIGDDIQGYAASLLAGKNFTVLDREDLDNASHEEPIKLICNGWFLDHPEHWPPAKPVHPLFISFHIGKYNHVRKALLDPKLAGYYNQFAPIGCRDYETLRLFEGMGVDAYFSGCLTLTLPKSEVKRSNKILVVDPFINELLDEEYGRKLMYKLIPSAYHNDIEFITHIRKDGNRAVDDRLADAEEFLDRYGRAKMIITSRIHCALPSLALGTPVFFMDVGYERKRNRDRFEGIIDLFNVVKPNLPFHGSRRVDKLLKLFGLHKLFLAQVKPLAIDFESPEPNPETYKEIAEALKTKVAEFLSKE